MEEKKCFYQGCDHNAEYVCECSAKTCSCKQHLAEHFDSSNEIHNFKPTFTVIHKGTKEALIEFLVNEKAKKDESIKTVLCCFDNQLRSLESIFEQSLEKLNSDTDKIMNWLEKIPKAQKVSKGEQDPILQLLPLHPEEAIQKAKSLFPKTSESYSSEWAYKPTQKMDIDNINYYELILEMLSKIETVHKEHNEYHKKNRYLTAKMLESAKESIWRLLTVNEICEQKIENHQEYLEESSIINVNELEPYEFALILESKIIQIQMYDKNIVSFHSKPKDANIKLDSKKVVASINKIQQQINLIKTHLLPEFIEKLELNNLAFIKLTDKVIHEIIKKCCRCKTREQYIWKTSCEHYYCTSCALWIAQHNVIKPISCVECKKKIGLLDFHEYFNYYHSKDEYLKARNRSECRSCHEEQDLESSHECPKCKNIICFYCIQKCVVSKRREIQNFVAEIQCNVCQELVFIAIDSWIEKCKSCTKYRNILDFYEFECEPGENTHGLLCRMCWTRLYDTYCAWYDTPISDIANKIIENENKIWCPVCQENKLVFLGEKMCMSGNCAPCRDCQDLNPDICVICGNMMQDKNSEYGYNFWIRLN